MAGASSLGRVEAVAGAASLAVPSEMARTSRTVIPIRSHQAHSALNGTTMPEARLRNPWPQDSSLWRSHPVSPAGASLPSRCPRARATIASFSARQVSSTKSSRVSAFTRCRYRPPRPERCDPAKAHCQLLLDESAEGGRDHLVSRRIEVHVEDEVARAAGFLEMRSQYREQVDVWNARRSEEIGQETIRLLKIPITTIRRPERAPVAQDGLFPRNDGDRPHLLAIVSQTEPNSSSSHFGMVMVRPPSSSGSG